MSRPIAAIAVDPGAGSPPGYSSRQSLLLLVYMIAMTICLELTRLPIVILVDPIRTSFGIGDIEISLLLGALSSVPFVAMSLVGGLLSDRASRKVLLLCAASLWVSGALVCASAGNFRALAVGRVLIGIGAGMKLPIAMTWINDAFPVERRGRAIGAFFVVLGSGPSLAIILAGWVAAHAAGWPALLGGAEPWRTTLALLTLPTLLLLPVLLLLPDGRASGDMAAPAAMNDAAPPLVMMALIIGGAALIAMVDSANLAWFSTILIRDHRVPSDQTGAIFGVATIVAGLAGPLAGGAIGDILYRRSGTRGRVFLAAAAAFAIVPLMLLYRLPAVPVLVLTLILSGICTVTALSVSYVIVQAVLPERRRGFGTGIVSASTTLLGSAGPTLVAAVSAWLGTRPHALANAVAIVVACAALLATLLFVTCGRHLRRSGATG